MIKIMKKNKEPKNKTKTTQTKVAYKSKSVYRDGKLISTTTRAY